MTNLSLNVWSYPDPTFTNVNDASQTAVVDPFSNVYLDDSLRSLLGTEEGRAQVYNALSSNPVLPPPGETAHVNINGQEFNLTSSQFGALQSKISQSYGTSIFESLGNLFSSGKMSEAQKNEALFYFLHPEIAPKSPVKELLDTAITNANKDFFPSGTVPPDFKPQANQQFFAKLYDRASTAIYDSKFEAIIQAKVSSGTLTQAEANKLIFSHYHADADTPLSPEEQQALKQTQQEMGYPAIDEWTPKPDTANFDGKVMSEYDSSFDEQLKNIQNTPEFNKLVQDSGLSKEFVLSALKFQHYHPNANITEFGAQTADFKNLYNTMNVNALKQTQNVTGIPNDFQPETATAIQEGIFNGAYRDTVLTKMMDYWNGEGQSLSKDDMNKIANWFVNPNDPSIPDNLKAIAQKIQQEAIAEIKGTYNLPGVWEPGLINNFAFANSPMHKAFMEIDGQLKLAVETIGKFPEPQRGVYMSFLKQVSSMLQMLKDSLYELEATDAARAKELEGSKLSQTMDKIAQQKEANKKDLEQRQKAEKWGILAKIFEPIMKFVTMVFAVVQFMTTLLMTAATAMLPPMLLATGPLLAAAGTAAALAICAFVDSCGGKLGLADKLFAAIDTACNNNPALAGIMKFAVMCAVVAAAGGATAMDLGPTLFEKCGVMQAIIKAAGGDEQAQQLGAMIMAIILGIAAAIIAAVATAGASAAGSGANIAGQIAQSVPKAVNAVIQPLLKTLEASFGSIEKALKFFQNSIEIFTKLMQGTGQMAQAIIMKRVIEIKGENDAKMEIISAMIKMVQKVLDGFLDSLQGHVDFVGSVNNTMKKNWDQMSQALTGLTQA